MYRALDDHQNTREEEGAINLPLADVATICPDNISQDLKNDVEGDEAETKNLWVKQKVTDQG